jgi:hypothetical protein
MLGKTLKKRKEQRKEIQAKRRPFPVLIGVPVPKIDQKITSDLSMFIEACAAQRVAWTCRIPSNLAEYARNKIIDAFLNDPDHKGFTHLLFMDHDTAPVDPYMLNRLLAHDKDVVAGITPIFLPGRVVIEEVEEDGVKKRIRREIPPSFQWNVQVSDRKGNLPLNVLSPDLFKAEKVGGTSILIKRHVLEKLPRPFQESTLNKNHDEFIATEDYYFCDQIRKAGFDIWIDPTLMCHHYHTVDLLEMVHTIAEIKMENDEPMRLLKDVYDRFSTDLRPGEVEPGSWEDTLARIKKLVGAA